jgi:intracellular septation protein
MTFEHAPNEPHTPAEKKLNPWLKLALEMGPLLVFFLANARGEAMAATWPLINQLGGPIFFATASFVVATVLALAVSFALTRRLPLMPFVTAIVVVVFGGMTLWFQNETFIKVKPTIIYVLFGGTLLGGLLFGKSFLGYIFDAVFKLTDEGWRKLTIRWGVFFFFLAVLNEVIWRMVSTDTWVSFKVFGFVPLTFVFALAQMPLINRYTLPEEGGAGSR